MSLPLSQSTWASIETVFLDMDGTLLDLHFDNHFWLEHLPQRYAEIKGKKAQDAEQELLAMYAAKKGSLDWYCLDYWSEVLDVNIVALKQEVAERINVLPGVESFLQWVRKQDKRIVMVTNAHRDSLELKLQRVTLGHYFDRLISAHDLCEAKEVDGFWEKLQHEEPFITDRTLLIDDNASVLASAQRYGIKWLYGIAQPDRQQPQVKLDGFTALESLVDLVGGETD
ncbi:MAG TPA: hypothetical protein EYH06_00390 [Chromatiales bacterium]|nr:hypothetical protein [Thiotrichales bacterium]HIP67029.1 hypothetical protein [Chromatiales bacterium]